MKRHFDFSGRMAALSSLTALCGMLLATGVRGETNQWTHSTSGKWQDPYWSLGVLPDASQTVEIKNSGYKSVEIGSKTVQNHPDSLTVRSLLLGGPTSSFNTLLLNYTSSTSLTATNGLTIETNSRLINLHSSLVVSGGGLTISNGELNQTFGDVTVTNGALTVNGTYESTNGNVNADTLAIGTRVANPGSMIQNGGAVNAGQFQCGMEAAGNYRLESGWLITSNESIGTFSYPGHLAQTGGTNTTDQLSLSAGFVAIPPAEYSLQNGFLGTSNTEINGSVFEQTGGLHGVSDTLMLEGAATHGEAFVIARYLMNGGTLETATLRVEDNAVFAQTNGTTRLSGTIEFSTPEYYEERQLSSLAGGVLTCDNVAWSGAGSDFAQSGGTLVVSNLLSFGGVSTNPPLGEAAYELSGGLLAVSNLEVDTTMKIDSSATANNITNTGYFRLAGNLTTEQTEQMLGRFILESDSTLDLAGSASVLAFANSSGEDWAPGTLEVGDWNGKSSGGGSEQLRFGSSSAGLTESQLSRIQFVNPSGFPDGTYDAKILETGEVVPGQAASAPVELAQPEIPGDGTFEFTVTSVTPGATYEVQTSTNLTDWTALTNITAESDSFTVARTNFVKTGRRFYRLAEQ